MFVYENEGGDVDAMDVEHSVEGSDDDDGGGPGTRTTLRGLRPAEASVAAVEVAVGSSCGDSPCALANDVPVCCGIPVTQACAGHWYGGCHQHRVWWGVQDKLRADRKNMRAAVVSEWGVRDETGAEMEAF